MKILLVYPEYPETFWSFKYALNFISKKALNPPLGLLTVAGLLPDRFEKKLVDMNVMPLRSKDVAWADMVFISAMVIQKKSVQEVIHKCRNAGVKIAAGGPLFTSSPSEFENIDHLVLNEAEITLPLFLKDLENSSPGRIYTSDSFADIRKTPQPRWDILNMKKYAAMNVQYSRGCPFNCEFCDITALFGRRHRTKTTAQVIGELDSLYQTGWRGNVFFVDDNFIGNKHKLKQTVLPAIIRWSEKRNHPFAFNTQTSIDIADDKELMDLMVKARFDAVFVGIETPNSDSLTECGKLQNKNRDLVHAVKTIHQAGLQVQAGFIVGFDHDPPSIFDSMINFIQTSGIVTAMVGLLNAPIGTNLYKRLLSENRLLKESSGNNTDMSINFIPKMDYQSLISGYQKVVKTIYSPKNYYARIAELLKDYKPTGISSGILNFSHIKALMKSFFVLGIFNKGMFYYWKLMIWSAFFRPRLLPLAVTLSIYGFHFRKIFDDINEPV